MRWLIGLWLLAAVHQCRHLSAGPDHRRSLNKGRRVMKTATIRSPPEVVMEETPAAEEDWTDVVLKLEVHMSNRNNNNNRKWKTKVVTNTNGTSTSLEGGFIHLFLPLSSSQASGPEIVPTTTTTTTTTTTERASAKRFREHQKKRKSKQHSKRKSKKRRKEEDDSGVDVIPIDQPEEQQSKRRTDGQQHLNNNNRLDAQLQAAAEDAGIPPLFNSLSTNETAQWARWLRCTLCLKGKESALCQTNVECQTGNVTENELTASGCQDRDVCSQWQRCEDASDIPSQFAALPPCPCLYPTGLVYNDRVWDPLNRHFYRWREISLQSERVDIYRPGAAYCIRSLSVVAAVPLSAQQCCYDDRRRLLTRGWAAGTPALVSHEASSHLSRVTERLPWLACKGDFSRYHLQRPPDNRLNCTANPSDQEYQRQVLLATNY